MKPPNSLSLATLLALVISYSPAFADTPRHEAWLKPIAEAWQVKPLLNVGDAVGEKSYRMVGIPDGLGARIGISV